MSGPNRATPNASVKSGSMILSSICARSRLETFRTGTGSVEERLGIGLWLQSSVFMGGAAAFTAVRERLDEERTWKPFAIANRERPRSSRMFINHCENLGDDEQIGHTKNMINWNCDNAKLLHRAKEIQNLQESFVSHSAGGWRVRRVVECRVACPPIREQSLRSFAGIGQSSSSSTLNNYSITFQVVRKSTEER